MTTRAFYIAIVGGFSAWFIVTLLIIFPKPEEHIAWLALTALVTIALVLWMAKAAVDLVNEAEKQNRWD